MAGLVMNVRTPLVALLLATLPLGGCGRAPSQQPPLAGAAIGGPFALTDQDGQAVTDKDFAVQYRAI